MVDRSELTIFLQMDLLTVLSYYNEPAFIIRNTIELDLFGDVYNRSIASQIYQYIDQYNEVPGDHLPDLFETTLLDRSDSRATKKSDNIGRVLEDIYNHRTNVNVKYTLDRLDRFVRYQEIRKATLTILEEFKENRITDEGLERAEQIISTAAKKRISTAFDSGISLGDSERSLAFLQEPETDIFPTGIPDLDKEDLGPKRGAMHLFVGLPKHGKTWWMIHLGRFAYLHGHKVLHVSLEMSANQISRRYHQSLWYVARRLPADQTLQRTKLSSNIESGRLNPPRLIKFTPKHTFDDTDIYKYLLDKHRRIRKRLNRVKIKSFPTGQLTVSMLETYLDTLEMQEGFIPDLLLIDYPQLMKIGAQFHRLELGKIVQNLRGIAVQRNMAVAAVSQSSRKGLGMEEDGPPLIGMGHIAEDFSQVMTVDVMLTYNQTREERARNLARIYVAAARDQDADFVIMISQQYQTGQFCSYSHRMDPRDKPVLEEYLKAQANED